MKYAPPGGGDLAAIKADGTLAPVTVSAAAGVGCTLTSGTWYFPVGGNDSPTPGETPYIGIQLQWTAATAGTITFETCNYPRYLGGARSGPDDITDNDGNATKTNWVQQNPTTLYVPTPTGAGNSVANLTITAGGTNAGGTFVDVGNTGAKRWRVKMVLSVGGFVRVNANGKGGG